MSDQPDDEILFQSFQRGDQSAFEVLARRREPSMLGLARGLVGGDSSAACDAVQNAWVRIIRSAGTFKGQSAVRTWMFRILVNECRRMRLTVKRSTMRIEGLQAHGTDARATDLEVEETDENSALRAALERLPAATREAVLICFHHGVTHAVAAEVLDVPLGTLKTRVRSALHELRSALSTEPAR